MAYLIGIDEAGYGPALGPLVVCGCVFRVPDELAEPEADLWAPLAPAVVRAGRCRADQLRIADSKLVHQGRERLKRLETSVLGACPVDLPTDLPTVAGSFGIAPEHLADGEPWHADGLPQLPLEADAGRVAALREIFDAACRHCGITLHAVFGAVAQPWRFNRMVRASDNKAAVLWQLSAELLERALAATADAGEPTAAVMDKQGGRNYYGPLLVRTFPMTMVDVLAESSRESRYRMTTRGRAVDVTLREGADKASLPAALASMVAKYLREVFMHAFNRWWAVRAAEVAPTSGYWSDYPRWARQMAPLLAQLELPEERYVRCR